MAKFVCEIILPAIRKTGKFTRDVINARMAAPSLPQLIVRPLFESTGRAFKNGSATLRVSHVRGRGLRPVRVLGPRHARRRRRLQAEGAGVVFRVRKC
uniref:Bro-k n=1 Tax=Lymantria dispar multicapsid nuclear polyhedrosis virus TaxID=10449 RepID=A0A4Y5X3X6_NPVLD|nr:bro-k [Lymantria dispar multiple nucleopolyhedrovirus]